MMINESIGNEAIFFGVSILCGVGLVFVYDFFRIFRRIVVHGTIWIGIEDISYWFFCTVVVFLLLYQMNDGMIRAFAFLGIALGGILYTILFSRFIVKACVWFLGSMLNILKRIFGTILTPFFKVGKKTSGCVLKQLKKIYRTIKIGLYKK